MASKNYPRSPERRKKRHTRDEERMAKREERRQKKHDLEIMRKRIKRTGKAPSAPAE
ncbi:MAG: hypothetical protein KC519_00320 [Anaerolineae bacterium]|nr:hypothetical protein [Anaerolineae bacterium]